MNTPNLNDNLKRLAMIDGCSICKERNIILKCFGVPIKKLRDEQAKQLIRQNWDRLTCKEMSQAFDVSENYLLSIRRELGEPYIYRRGGDRRGRSFKKRFVK